jgi:hypothetical protein
LAGGVLVHEGAAKVAGGGEGGCNQGEWHIK